MTLPPEEVLDATPGDRARAAADALGDVELTRWCGDLLGGRVAYGEAGEPDPGWLAGRVVQTWGSPARLVGSGHDRGWGAGEKEYWVRTWAARTLLYVWDPGCAPDIVAGLGDPAWRVREMCAKVACRWEVVEAADPAAAMLADEIPRVRIAALRVLAAVGEHEHLAAVEQARDDEEPTVRTAAEKAGVRLRERLDAAYP